MERLTSWEGKRRAKTEWREEKMMKGWEFFWKEE